MSDKAKEVVNAIKKYNYDTAVIVLANPNDLTEMSKSDFPDYKFAHAHFVAERAIERGEIIMLSEDSDVKRAVYELIKEHPEKEWSWKEIRNEYRKSVWNFYEYRFREFHRRRKAGSHKRRAERNGYI